jgi:hypothetical protein
LLSEVQAEGVADEVAVVEELAGFDAAVHGGDKPGWQGDAKAFASQMPTHLCDRLQARQ